MTLIALLDADQLIHRYALKFDTNYIGQLTNNLDRDISKLLTDCGCTHYRIFTGSYEPTFRDNMRPSYKANREPTPNKDVFRDHLVRNWRAIKCIGYEVDDAQAMEQNKNTILIHDDKDLLQVVGRHFIPQLWRNSEMVRDNKFLTITELEGLKNVYTQSLVGDTSDNIEGISGIGIKRANSKLKHCQTELDMFETCLSLYDRNIDKFLMTMNMLWMWRKFGENYSMRPIIKIFLQNV